MPPLRVTHWPRSYYSGATTVARWTVREPPSKKRKAKNVLFFIGDGMTISMQTAARLIAHKSINGKYQSLLQMDQVRARIMTGRPRRGIHTMPLDGQSWPPNDPLH